MNDNHTSRTDVHGSAIAVARPTTIAKPGALLFRIVGPHQHRAVLGGRVFWCERETTPSHIGVSIRWSAFEGKILLRSDCRTLNEAKKLCREALGAG